MKKQTAVEWLITRLYPTIIIRLNESYIKEITDKAKEMEKQQIIKTRQDIYVTGNLSSEQYYNQTFKQ